MGWLISLFTGGTVTALIEAYTEAKRRGDDKEASELKAKIDLAIAAAQHDKWWSTRELIGKCVFIYVFKIVVWDTVLKLGVTPNPGNQVTFIVMIVIGFYFASKSAEKVADIIGNAIARRK